MGGHIKDLFGAISLFGVGANDLGDDVARLTNGNRIAEHYSLLADKINIVERGTADRRSGKSYRIKDRRRCKHAGSAERKLDIDKLRFLLLWRELVCNRPFRCARSVAEDLALRKIIHLYYNAVNIVRKVGAERAYLIYMRLDLICR